MKQTILKKLVLTGLVCNSIGLLAQTTIVLQPGPIAGIDASLGSHTNFNTENNNYGTNIYNNAYCIPGAQGGQNSNRTVMNFDLSAVPANATIVSATLTLYGTGFINSLLPGHFGNNTAYLKRITSSWSENSVTWNSAPQTTNVNQVSVPASTSASQDYSILVTALVQDMLANPSSSFGFHLGLQTENPNSPAALLFHSSDASDSTKWPKLEIIYESEWCVQPDPNSGLDASLGFHTNFNTDVNNYGTNVYLNAYCIPGAQGGENTNRAVLKFDLSSIPASATVQSADLYLYATGYINNLLPGHFGNNSATLERITSNWSENTVTFSTAPTTTTSGAATLPASTSGTQDYIVSVTSMTQFMVSNPSQNFGYFFKLVTENPNNSAALLFWSSDHSDPLKRPKLCVTYEDNGNPKSIEIVGEVVPFSISPNPSSNFVNVTLNETFNKAAINLYSIDGKLIYTSQLQSTIANSVFQLDMTQFPAGTYIIEVIGDNRKGTAKFIKQ